MGSRRTPQASTEVVRLDDSVALAAYIEGNSRLTPFQVTAVLRCVDLLSASLAMLPVRIVERYSYRQDDTHPLNDLLQFEPNDWQTAFEFFRLMERRRITEGNAYAYVVRSGDRPIALQPLDPRRVKVTQKPDWTLEYRVSRKGEASQVVPPRDILHVRDLADDEVCGNSRLDLAKRAIETARDAEIAQRNIFNGGSLAKGMLTLGGELSDPAFARLKKELAAFDGPGGAGRLMLGEEGMGYVDFGMTGRDAQTAEARSHQIEEIARVFGVPRPMLMVDDTSWGSGVAQLATLYVQFTLAPALSVWEQSLRRTLLTPTEKRTLIIDMDERQLMRGSPKEQAELYAKAAGAGGHRPWMHTDEIRRDLKMPMRTDEQKTEMEPSNAQAQPNQSEQDA
ncbi:MAG: phage portal protein [Litorimonas sp.]